jgi:TatD DNase family protein
MDYAYTYADPSKLYLNVTNRCSNRCGFCVRNAAEGLGGKHLWGGQEPDEEAMTQAIARSGGAAAFSEIIWCGFGEPTYRLDLIVALSPRFRQEGCRVRLNTNGHANLIHGRDVLPDLGEAIDEVSVSLNAPTCKRYLELCQPLPAPATGAPAVPPEAYWEIMIDFLRRAPAHIATVQASVVGFALTNNEVEASRDLAASLGVTRFRVR